MARVTVEDCLEKVTNQYDLVLLAKERTHQISSGAEIKVELENDKKTVISLREIAEGHVLPNELEESAINKLRKYVEEVNKESEDFNEVEEDDEFKKIYKGEVSKSGVAVLPSKRARKIPFKPISSAPEKDEESVENKDMQTPSEENKS